LNKKAIKKQYQKIYCSCVWLSKRKG